MSENPQEKEFETLTEEFENLSEYVQDLWQFLPLPIFNISTQGIILDTNQAFVALSGCPLPETIGKPLNNFLSPKETREIIKQTSEKKYLAGRETILYDSNKEKIPVSLYARAREDKEKNVIGFFLALIDTRENKKFQEELEKRVKEKTKELLSKTKELESSEKALMNILEDVEETRYNLEEEKNKTLAIITNLVDGLLFFDKDNRLVLLNPGAKALLETVGESIIGKTSGELSAHKDIGQIMGAMKKSVMAPVKTEVSVSEERVLALTTIPVILERKKIGTVILLHDVTRERLVERMKTEFVSLAAHQLRTPLSAIKWTMKMLLDEDLGKITDEQKAFIQKAYHSNERMIHLINDLLNVTRIEEGRFLFKSTPLQIADIILTTINNLKEKADRKKIEVSFIRPKKLPPPIAMDAEKMEIAATNLIDNAIDYTPEGGKVNASLSCDKKEIKFAVSDSGVGIPANQQKRIFSKFFRGENVIKMETEGTGLGLFITKNVIETHGGKIWFESKEGNGTTFYFTLPITGNASDAPEAKPPAIA